MNKAYSNMINKGYPKKSLDTENFEQGFSVPIHINILGNKTTIYLFISLQITYASSNLREKQAYSLLMNKYMFAIQRHSSNCHHMVPIGQLFSCYPEHTILGGYSSAKRTSEM